MPCYSPLKAYRAKNINPSGKRGIVFNPNDGYRDLALTIPCGQCIGCRLEKSRQWAIRCVHEASLYKDNSFITLTYSPENLPEDMGLVKKDFQDFMKRLRKHYKGKKIRYYHCGEYGEKNLRPHYHACLFNHDFHDKELWKETDGIYLYRSNTLDSIWKHGFTSVGDVTFESAAYVARYITKKVTGQNAEKAYERVDPVTGEIFNVIPEYTTMSRRPGIGKDWYEKYKDEVLNSDAVLIRGKEMQPPKYYDEQSEELEKIKRERKKKAFLHKENNTADRLAVREKVKLSQLKTLKRKLDED